VVVLSGCTTIFPPTGSTFPIPPIVTLAAPETCQFNVDSSPVGITAGFASKESILGIAGGIPSTVTVAVLTSFPASFVALRM